MSVKKIKKTVRLYENLLSVNIPTAKNTPQFERYMPIDVEDIKRKFITLSNKLYGILMEPFHGELSETERIYLIPDDFLWRLPFETLIDNINYDLAYNQLSYLQNKWLISYHFSLPLIHYLYIENKEKRREKTIQSIMIAVSDQGNLSDIEYDAILNWQDMMNPKLPTIIGELCPEGVSPVQALRDIPSEIVLIWAHGELNEGIRIREEERITTSDIQAGKKLNWKFLIVPNCHVGHGLLRDGEGMISLHRSFFSSGVENIIFPVNKLKAQGAIYVLNEFFNLLSDSEPVLISKALQQAKIKVSKREGSVPSDWAGLLFTGHQKDHINNSPPRNKGRILDFCSKFIQRSLKIKR
jgi:CHAT domain-containing protein